MASRRAKWIVIAIIIGVVVIGLWVAAFAVVSGSGGYSGEYDEQTASEGSGDSKVVMIDINGEIVSSAQTCTEGAADSQILAELDQALDDSSVAAVILNLDTPGGGVVASDNIHRKVLEVRRAGIPVVALMDEVAASGGYYIASAADEIVANPATITGSIGVIMLVPNLEKTAEKIGLSTEVIKSGPNKDIASPFTNLSNDQRAILQALIDEAYDQFVDVVAKGRDLDEAKVRQIADGRIYSGKQAKALGLVNELGGREVALGRARTLGGAPDGPLVRYSCSPGLSGLLGPLVKSPVDKIEGDLKLNFRAGLRYLWLG